MSTTFTSYIIAGVPLWCRSVEVSVTRYNELTGAPYQKTVAQDKWFLSDGSEFAMTDNLYALRGDLDDPGHRVLLQHNDNAELHYLGVVVYKAEPNDKEPLVNLDHNASSASLAKAQKFLTGVGINESPQLYLVSSVSY